MLLLNVSIAVRGKPLVLGTEALTPSPPACLGPEPPQRSYLPLEAIHPYDWITLVSKGVYFQKHSTAFSLESSVSNFATSTITSDRYPSIPLRDFPSSRYLLPGPYRSYRVYEPAVSNYISPLAFAAPGLYLSRPVDISATELHLCRFILLVPFYFCLLAFHCHFVEKILSFLHNSCKQEKWPTDTSIIPE